MKKVLFAGNPIWANQILALIRVIVGIFMIYHGWEVFDSAKMEEYAKWDPFKGDRATLAYIGKSAELIGGILLLIGFLTRFAAIILAGTMLYIVFGLGNGKVWYEDQHPFLFVLLAAVFFFVGPGSWAVDNKFLNQGRTS